jgi:pyruvate/2-oxoglutarate dehydrogenase complex dihydrolipoamide dehydrogenase (E3) component
MAAVTVQVDVIVLGVGTCGEDLALHLLDAGLDVVGVEAALVGGECAYWACLPSKMMIRAAGVLQEARRVDGLAGSAAVVPSWAAVADRVRREATGGWNDALAVARFTDRGGRLVHGRGALTAARSVSVGGESFEARRGVVIATGSVPVIPPIPGLSEVEYWTTHDVIKLDELPESVVVLGGGAVGCELAQVLSRFDTAVTIVEAGERLLPAEEPEASEVLESAFTAEGITVCCGARAALVSANDRSITVELMDGAPISADHLVVATGRRVDLNGLGLESVGLDPSAQVIPVDERMRAAEGIWAMGDVTGKAMFTHVALYQSAIVAAEILGEPHPPARYDAVPRVTFTDPEVATVGLTESEARSAGLDVAVAVKRLPATFRGWLHASGRGLLKLVSDAASDVLIGATAVGPQGGETLGLLNLAVHARVPLAELRSMIYAFPTFYGSIGEALGAYGQGLTTVLDPDYPGFRASAAGSPTPPL